MTRRRVFRRGLGEALVLTVIILSSISVLSAYVSSSSNYRLESDSINFGGGRSDSNNFSLESTLGEVATGRSTSTNFSLRAGYQQMQEVFVSLTVASTALKLSPALGGLSGGVARGSTTVTVLTDSPSGYELTIAALTNPAMRNGLNVIADYTPVASPAPDYSFLTGPTNAHFGFTAAGVDVVSRFRNNGSLCSTGSLSTPERCWIGLATTTTSLARGLANQPSGTVTELYFQVGIGGNAGVVPGTYTATTTLTALPL